MLLLMVMTGAAGTPATPPELAGYRVGAPYPKTCPATGICSASASVAGQTGRVELDRCGPSIQAIRFVRTFTSLPAPEMPLGYSYAPNVETAVADSALLMTGSLKAAGWTIDAELERIAKSVGVELPWLALERDGHKRILVVTCPEPEASVVAMARAAEEASGIPVDMRTCMYMVSQESPSKCTAGL